MCERTVTYMNCKEFDRLVAAKNGFYLDSCEGVLVDSCVVVTVDGTYFAYEHYVNSNMSDLKVVFIPNSKSCSREDWFETINEEWDIWKWFSTEEGVD